MINEYVLARLRCIQKEFEELQRAASRQMRTRKNKVKLKGLWKGVYGSEEDLQEAKRSIFKDAYNADD
jgi:hypothetical protein